jgi:hypothetical protein
MKNALKDMIYEGSRKALKRQMQITVDAFEIFILTVIVGVIFIL